MGICFQFMNGLRTVQHSPVFLAGEGPGHNSVDHLLPQDRGRGAEEVRGQVGLDGGHGVAQDRGESS